MSYPRVISLLDAQLERLRAARRVLTAEPEDSPSAESAAELAEAAATLSKTPGGAVLADRIIGIIPEARRIAPKQRRERRVVARKRGDAQESALASAAPHAPVYVSADKLKSVRTDKETAAAALTQSGETLTPEMLSRRWLQPSKS